MGPLLCLASATGFGLLAIFAKLAYAAGVTVPGLLTLRFGLAAALLLALAGARGALRGLPRRGVLAGFAMGSILYAAQSGLYFSALPRVDTALVALLYCTYPLLVMGVAVATGREAGSPRRVVAGVAALGGTALVLGGVAGGVPDLLGVTLAAGSALVYTAYVLIGDRVGTGMPPLALSGIVCAGAFATYLAVGLLGGGLTLGFAPLGWVWIGGLVAVSTIGAILLFFAGLARVGPTVTSLLGGVEPVVTVGVAAAVFGEALGRSQLVGAGLVVGAVVVVQWPAGLTRSLRMAGLGVLGRCGGVGASILAWGKGLQTQVDGRSRAGA